MNRGRKRFFPTMILLTGFGYVSFLLSKAIFVVIGVSSFLLLSPWPKARQGFLNGLLCRFLGFFTRVWLPLLRVYDIVEISGRGLIESCRPAVVVANHRSFMDSIFLLGLSPRTGALTKDKHARQLIYYLLVRYYDLVSVDGESLESVRGAFARCRELLAAGKNLVVFPEGTRAKGGRLQPFNRFAFDLALAAGVPVLPVVIHSTEPFMCKIPGSAFPRRRNFFRIRFLEPEPLRAGDDGDALRYRIHRRIAQELKLLDAGTGWDQRQGH